MFLTELKEEYPLIYERVIEQCEDSSRLAVGQPYADVNTILNWHNTTEGFSFWAAIHVEDWNKAKDLQPHLFPESNKFAKIVINGLFKQVENV